ncbi:sugar ABC transporter permease (plasmid) [Curtobacterium sp. MCLR17_007]|uniref:carbohydrate ABC transporter permease n=1 Tax=Curtobacterium sp. MCLR17_007 TaxID=2175648 RepID=UPI000DAA64B6|nr:sugar ABC transporter permease [Curtobacterium sp. MCLR17_007]WIB62110.1 sugar ABC transporter permease [Curtobacterium sp. MCLR17_007]
MRTARRGLIGYWREYVSVAPFFIIFACFSIIPLIYAGYLSTQKWDGLGASQYVGLDQWVRLFSSGEFLFAAGNTIVIFVMGQVPVVLGALVAAVLLSQPRLRGRAFYQAAFFLPQVTSLVVVAVVFQAVFSTRFGIVNFLAQLVGLPTTDFLNDPWATRVVIALMIIWRGFGYFLVIFMAGLSSIDGSLYEAARIDGAGPTRILSSITIPMLRPTVIFVSLTGTIGGLQLFTEPQLLFAGTNGPGNAGQTMLLLQYQYLGGPGSAGFSSPVHQDLGYATVIGWATFIILLIIAAISYRFLKNPMED